MKPSDITDEVNDPVWELLGKARKIETSHAFVQNTVRQVRQLGADGATLDSTWSRFFNLLRRPVFALPLTAMAVVSVALIINTSSPQSTVDDAVAANGRAARSATGTSLVEASQTARVADFSFTDQVEEIDYLGDLVVVTDPSALNEQMLADLFY